MNTKESGRANSSAPAYLLNNGNPEASRRFDALSTTYDSTTIRHLESLGIGEGWTCLEVGGGGGSIAAWLADRVGPRGRVLATDIDPRFLQSLRLPNVEVQKHNVLTDPLPEAAFDLIHLRLVLIHLPEREKVLARLLAALKFGGWLVDEEFDSASLLPDGSVSPGEVLLKSQQVAMHILDEHGVDRRCGRRLFRQFREIGLVDVEAEAQMSMWHRQSPGASLMRANFVELRHQMIASGYVTDEEWENDVVRLDDPQFMTPSPIMWTVRGRRPQVA
jgi:ubiquinone/menaquinone biosynthesis C-methylase UbiE